MGYIARPKLEPPFMRDNRFERGLVLHRIECDAIQVKLDDMHSYIVHLLPSSNCYWDKPYRFVPVDGIVN